MPKLTLVRDSPLRRDRWRRYRVLIDGELAGLIGHGETEEFDVSPGQHVVQLKVDWCGSPPLSLDDVGTEGVELTCGPDYSPWFPLWRAIFRPGHWISLRPANQTQDPN
jgi:hypothetical protein